ncbi:hypothetical protein [Paraburkholderia sp. BCC1885]|uniref:hypothetical protein n=1 Tax=Paraburkholderia sp. BCC1885 TaxID=2562669 RepID=UPI0011845A03|nr:hypothetical protein [Paraburkholderia sp. BCC1885]
MSYTLEVETVKAINARVFPLELPIVDYGGVIDDDFARRFGSATLNLPALTHPDMKPLIKTTQDHRNDKSYSRCVSNSTDGRRGHSRRPIVASVQPALREPLMGGERRN